MYVLQRISLFSHIEKALKHSLEPSKFCEKRKKIDEIAATTLQSTYRPREIKNNKK